MSSKIIVGLDIGTTKICAVIAEVRPDGIEIIGMGSHPSKGLRKGMVVSIDNTVQSIKEAVEEAETMAGCEINSVYAGIAGRHIKAINSGANITLKEREVTERDIERVRETAKSRALPSLAGDRKILHTLVQEYSVDGQNGILDPIGMSGLTLEAKVHIITGAVSSAQNIIKCANRAGLDVRDIVLESLASSKAVLSKEEMNLGTTLIDFGGGTTDMAVFSRGSIKHTSALSVGGDNLTTDISLVLRTPQMEAEKLKIKYGSALSSMVNQEETVEVPRVGGKEPRLVSRRTLAEILEARVAETFSYLYKDLSDAGYAESIRSGVVVTGGSAELPGVMEMAELIFDCPSRIGYPEGITGLADMVNRPMYATAVGLVIYGSQMEPEGRTRPNPFTRVLDRMKKWFRDVV